MGDLTADMRATEVMKEIKRDMPFGVSLPIGLEKKIADHISENANAAFNERARVLAGMCKMAQAMGMVAGVGRHPDEEKWDDDWRYVIYVDLPTGQWGEVKTFEQRTERD